MLSKAPELVGGAWGPGVGTPRPECASPQRPGGDAVSSSPWPCQRVLVITSKGRGDRAGELRICLFPERKEALLPSSYAWNMKIKGDTLRPPREGDRSDVPALVSVALRPPQRKCLDIQGLCETLPVLGRKSTTFAGPWHGGKLISLREPFLSLGLQWQESHLPFCEAGHVASWDS